MTQTGIKEYLVTSRTNGTTRTGAPYAVLKCANLTETINISVWDLNPGDAPAIGQLVYFYNIKDNAGKKSCSSSEMKVGDMPLLDHPLYNVVPRPIRRDKWDDTIEKLVRYCSDAKLIPIIRDFADKLFAPYSKYPAASGIHHAFPGGLLNHTYQMLHMLEGLYPCLPYPVKVERCILAILFHDYGKVYEYNSMGETLEDMYLMGHIFIGSHKLNCVLEEKGVDAEEIKRIVHCVLAHHGTKEFGSPVFPCTQEATIVNILDLLSARTDTMEGAGNMEMCGALCTRVVK